MCVQNVRTQPLRLRMLDKHVKTFTIHPLPPMLSQPENFLVSITFWCSFLLNFPRTLRHKVIIFRIIHFIHKQNGRYCIIYWDKCSKGIHFVHFTLFCDTNLTTFANSRTLREKCPYAEFFWSNTESYSISPYSVRMRKNTDQKSSKYGHTSRSGTNYFRPVLLPCTPWK